MRRWGWALALTAVVTTGCGWVTPRFDRQNRGTNPWEQAITPATVGSLVPTFRTDAEVAEYPGTTVLVNSRDLLAGSGSGPLARYRSYRVDGSGMDCTSTVPPICGPRWRTGHTTGEASFQDGRFYVGADVYALDPTSCSGAQPICAPERTLTPAAAAIPGDGSVGFPRMHLRSRFQPSGPLIDAEYLDGYAVDCTASTCDPVWSVLVTPVAHQQTAGTAVAADRVYVRNLYGRVVAFDLAGHEVWGTAAVDAFSFDESIVLAGTRLIVTASRGGEEVPRLLVYDTTAAAGCGGDPLACEPVWQSSPLAEARSAPAVVGDRVFVSTGPVVEGFDLGVDGCRAATCAPVWTADLGAATPTAPTGAGSVLYVGSDDGVRAFDTTGARGCTGTAPLVCTPLWSALTGTDVRSPVVVGGRVAVADAAGAVHVFALPPA